jgi:hypothetical protein
MDRRYQRNINTVQYDSGPSFFGYVKRSNNIIKHLLEGKVPGQRDRGRQRYKWIDKIKRWTGKTYIKRVYCHDRKQNCVEICGYQLSLRRRYLMEGWSPSYKLAKTRKLHISLLCNASL